MVNLDDDDRFMHQLFKDSNSMPLPTPSITFIANPKWVEIQRDLCIYQPQLGTNLLLFPGNWLVDRTGSHEALRPARQFNAARIDIGKTTMSLPPLLSRFTYAYTPQPLWIRPRLDVTSQRRYFSFRRLVWSIF